MGRDQVQVQATAVIVGARRGVDGSGGPDDGESYWWQDALDARFGKDRWSLELDVHLPGHAPYRVVGEWKVPNRLQTFRNAFKGKQTLRPGVLLPVLVDATDASKVAIDWDTFRRSGGADQVTASDEPTVSQSVKQAVADMRAGPSAPTHPRPTAASHPPIEGVDYDRFVAAVAGMKRKMTERDREVRYAAQGFPPGRGDAIAAAWSDRLRDDGALLDWYQYDMRRLGS